MPWVKLLVLEKGGAGPEGGPTPGRLPATEAHPMPNRARPGAIRQFNFFHMHRALARIVRLF